VARKQKEGKEIIKRGKPGPKPALPQQGDKDD